MTSWNIVYYLNAIVLSDILYSKNRLYLVDYYPAESCAFKNIFIPTVQDTKKTRME
jgi:hypothetical protein